jgi:hypothetical protein
MTVDTTITASNSETVAARDELEMGDHADADRDEQHQQVRKQQVGSFTT